MRSDKHMTMSLAALAIGVLAAGGYFIWAGSTGESRTVTSGHSEQSSRAPVPADPGVRLTDGQLEAITLGAVGARGFSVEREAVGTIDFNQYQTVQMSPPWPGRIIELFAREGDDVRKGQALFTIDSPDLVEAESKLISAAGERDLTTRALARAKELYAAQGLAEKDYELAVSEQQTAVGAYRAARDAVRIFGKTDAEMDRIIAERHIDARLTVRSTVQGRVTARNAAPGTLVQPGEAPAPFTISDLSTKWMLASVTETDVPLLRLGQDVDVKLVAYPGRVFRGKIVRISESLDPITHRASVRSEVRDPGNELRPQMLATFTVHTGGEMQSAAVPEAAVVREGDGTSVVWVTTDRHCFTPRIVKAGLRQGGYAQILEGLQPGELAVTEGGVFLSNILFSGQKQD